MELHHYIFVDETGDVKAKITAKLADLEENLRACHLKFTSDIIEIGTFCNVTTVILPASQEKE